MIAPLSRGRQGEYEKSQVLAFTKCDYPQRRGSPGGRESAKKAFFQAKKITITAFWFNVSPHQSKRCYHKMRSLMAKSVLETGQDDSSLVMKRIPYDDENRAKAVSSSAHSAGGPAS